MNAFAALGEWFSPADLPGWGVFLLKATFWLAAVWLVHATLLRANPRWRVFLWRAAIVGLLALPLLSHLVPPIEVHIHHSVAVSPATSLPAPLLRAEGGTSLSAARGVIRRLPTPLVPQGVPPDPLPLRHRAPVGDGGNLTKAESPPATAADDKATAALPSIAGGRLLAIWLVGVLLLTARMGLGYGRLRRLFKGCRPAPDWLLEDAAGVAHSIGCRRRANVAVSADISTPLLCGIWRPRIILPEPLCQCPDHETVEGILAHELAHVRSADVAWNLAFHAVSILLWFHPLVWRIRRAHLEACDAVCDAVSAARLGSADGYCRLLARLAVAQAAPPAVGLAMARASTVARRIGVLRRKLYHAPLRWRSLLAAQTAGVAAAVLIASLHLAAAGDRAAAEGSQSAQTQPAATSPGTPAEAKPSTPATDAQAEKTDVPEGPLTLDIARFCNLGEFEARVLEPFSGRQVIDGLPFQIGGQARLWGQTVAERNPKKALPETFKGIRIDRTLDELHLIHYTMWPDVEGETVAYISLNYADGTKSILPIRYGVHLRDWYYLPSYEKELPTDTDTKICWGRPPVNFKAPVRLFKSRLVNPMPQKVVETMDVISARRLASYCLLAATVANRDPARPVTPPATAEEPQRKFDGKLTIEVVDDVTGKPIEGALVEPSSDVLEEWLVAAPFYTSAAGKGTIGYPIKQTRRVAASVKKEGYLPQWEDWRGGFPGTFTFRLTPAGDVAGGQRGSIIATLRNWLSPPAKPSATPTTKGGSRPLFLIDADGSNLRSFVSMPEYTAFGSPEWSRDGKKIAFDAWRSSQGETFDQGHVFVASADGSWIADLGPGGMPSWSPDGKQITFSHWHPASGVSIMNADGSDRHLLDADGWGAEWSPRRSEIAYVISPAGGQKLCIYDVGTKDRRTLLGNKIFKYIRQGFTWSPDGEHLCFKGILPDDTAQIAVVHREGQQKDFKVLLPSADVPNVSGGSPTVCWGGSGNQILFSVRGESDRNVQIHVLDFLGQHPARLLPGQDPGRDNLDVAWSPDGKRIVFASNAAVSAPQPSLESPRRKEVKAQTETVLGERPRSKPSPARRLRTSQS
jgi:beta-lactamase regulating signal transducer with metallopeptidase domain/Tol biopolymer transport system component